MRVFLDTNVLFSGFHSPRGAPNAILERATAHQLTAVVSPDVLAELVRNIQRKAPYLSAEVSSFLQGTALEVVEPSKAQTDRLHQQGFGTDAPIVAAAAGAEVDYFCSGDRRLLERVRRARRGLRAASPAELLRLLE